MRLHHLYIRYAQMTWRYGGRTSCTCMFPCASVMVMSATVCVAMCPDVAMSVQTNRTRSFTRNLYPPKTTQRTARHHPHTVWKPHAHTKHECMCRPQLSRGQPPPHRHTIPGNFQNPFQKRLRNANNAQHTSDHLKTHEPTHTCQTL